MTIKLWLGHKKYVIKKWLKDHRIHITAVTALAALWIIAAFWGGNKLAAFLDKEFIQSNVPTELTQSLTK